MNKSEFDSENTLFMSKCILIEHFEHPKNKEYCFFDLTTSVCVILPTRVNDLSLIKMKIISTADEKYDYLSIDSWHYFVSRDAPFPEQAVYSGRISSYDRKAGTIEIRRVGDPTVCADVVRTLARLGKNEEEI